MDKTVLRAVIHCFLNVTKPYHIFSQFFITSVEAMFLLKTWHSSNTIRSLYFIHLTRCDAPRPLFHEGKPTYYAFHWKANPDLRAIIGHLQELYGHHRLLLLILLLIIDKRRARVDG